LLLAAIAALLEFIPVFGPLLSALIILIVAGLAEFRHLLWIMFFIVGLAHRAARRMERPSL